MDLRSTPIVSAIVRIRRLISTLVKLSAAMAALAMRARASRAPPAFWRFRASRHSTMQFAATVR